MIKQVCQSFLNVTQRLKILALIRKDEHALVTMVLTTIVLTTMVLIADPDGGFSDEANTTLKGVSQVA
ncbi:MAG: hypothetical protein HOB98_08150 [Gammaproteobacteria bacterium]|jgi:hypothetical protein|nr:hypothetical protein [Gammaproteobacteria bacterium]MBT3870220.1 hypothetical protein [Gammaproteobacteria bacterium]MBT4381080.1 hypothetical protein [Gammaproteobacteria bacterium]MBT4616404.1 hypothetical protein [Gammaproteobacteria bacterium]MBT5196906.1 hypothetical protein [Gammaproteobacteria bacterium]